MVEANDTHNSYLLHQVGPREMLPGYPLKIDNDLKKGCNFWKDWDMFVGDFNPPEK